ncbi:hypothetical protein ABZ921_33575 [Streptomyces atriruber]|uniref:Uncharacterized protein n=1 Tax=Streptomyces atriruber TaxID=545121 RepID=A0ABV3BX22_9ACTN
MEVLGDSEGGQVTDAVGVRFEGGAPDGDPLASEIAIELVAGEVDHAFAAPMVDRVDLSEDPRGLVDAEFTRPGRSTE